MIETSAKSVLIPLRLTAAASAADGEIQKKKKKKILGSVNSSSSHNNTVLVISNNEMEVIIKIVKSLEDFGLLLKGVTETVQNEVKDQKEGFLSMLLGTLGKSLLGNLLTGRGVNRAGKSWRINGAGEGIVRVGYGNKKNRKKKQNRFLMLLHPLTNSEIKKLSKWAKI